MRKKSNSYVLFQLSNIRTNCTVMHAVSLQTMTGAVRCDKLIIVKLKGGRTNNLLFLRNPLLSFNILQCCRLRAIGWCFRFGVVLALWRWILSRSSLRQNFWYIFLNLWLKLLRFFQCSTSHTNI